MKMLTLTAAAGAALLGLAACSGSDNTANETAPADTAAMAPDTTMTPPADSSMTTTTTPGSTTTTTPPPAGTMNPDGTMTDGSANPNSPPPTMAPDGSTPPA